MTALKAGGMFGVVDMALTFVSLLLPQEAHGEDGTLQVDEWVPHQTAGWPEGSYEHHDVYEMWR